MYWIIIVGGGVGGLELVMWFGDCYGVCGNCFVCVFVMFVDCNLMYIWKLLLYEVVVGSMDLFMQEFEYVVQVCWYGFEFQQGELIGFDCVVKCVMLLLINDSDGVELLLVCELEYDMFVIVIGSMIYFFGVQGVLENVIVFDMVGEVECFCKWLIVVCMCVEYQVLVLIVLGELVELCIQVVIVGGGVMGVELFVELCNIVQVLLVYGLYKFDLWYDVGIVLIELGLWIFLVLLECVLLVMVELFGKIGVWLMFVECVMEVVFGVVYMVSGKVVCVDLMVWVVGIKVLLVFVNFDGFQVNKLGQFDVCCML